MDKIFRDQPVSIEVCLINIETCSPDYGQLVHEQNEKVHAFWSCCKGTHFLVKIQKGKKEKKALIRGYGFFTRE